MRRFFKSAAFPILLVVILAFVAQRVISPGPSTETPSYNELIGTKEQGGLIATGRIEEATVNTKDNTLEVKEKGRNGPRPAATRWAIHRTRKKA